MNNLQILHIYRFPSEENREVFIQILQKVIGIMPVHRLSGTQASRVIYANDIVLIVFKEGNNYSYSQQVVAMTFSSSDPHSDAEKVFNILFEAGFDVSIDENPDPDLRPGSLVMVTSSAFPGWSLGFRLPLEQLLAQVKN